MVPARMGMTINTLISRILTVADCPGTLSSSTGTRTVGLFDLGLGSLFFRRELGRNQCDAVER